MASKVFGFFVKKTQSSSNINSPAAAANVPLPSSPSPIVTDLPASETTTTKEKEKKKDVVQQLRTPSPSIDSASIARRTSPAPTTANNTSYSAASTRQLSEPLVLPTPVQTEPTQPALLPTSSSLTTLIKTVPPKTLHAYVLEQLSSSSASVSSDTLESLCAFFNTLTPPPKLHCVRCHKDFTEVENDDRSCLVPHDDESAEVERVGRGSVGMTMKAMYETLWGCCGKTSEGDGSQGPPEGWCYEGKHTTDVKRARFRADSTPLDDKLTSCLRLSCHGIRDRMPRRGTSTRKRARQTYREATTDEEGSEGESDSGVEEITGKGKEKAQAGPARKKKAAPRKSKSKVKADEKEKEEGKGKEEEDKMDVDQELQLQEGNSSSKTAGSSTAKAPANTVATPTSAPPKRRGRPPKRKVDEPTEDGAESSGTVTPAPKRRGRPPKSKPLIEDSDIETAVSSARKLSLSPVRKAPGPGTSTPRTRSTSRGRQGQGQGGHVTRLAAEFNKRSESLKRPTPSRSRLGVVVSASAEVGEDGDVDVDMEESHPTKKKRKVVS